MTNEDRIYSVIEKYSDDNIIDFMKNNTYFIGTKVDAMNSELYNIPSVPYGYINNLTLVEIIDIVKKYLSFINPKYVLLLEQYINDGSMNMFDSDDEINLKTFSGEAFRSYLMDENGKYHHNINIPLSHNISDVYTIIHEFIHMTNFDINGNSDDRDFFTEACSILHEFILFDYLKNNGICVEDNCYPIFERIDSTIEYTNDLISILNTIDVIDITKVKQVKDDKIIYEDYKNMLASFEYPVGTLIGILKYDDYKNGIISIDNIESFNYSLNNCNEFESLRNIFLEVPDVDKIKYSVQSLNSELFSNKGMSK